MRNARLVVAVLAAAVTLSSCSSAEPGVSAPPSPTARPVYRNFIDNRLCDSVRFDLFETIIVDTAQRPSVSGAGRFVDCSSAYSPFVIKKPYLKLVVYVLDTPEEAEQAHVDKGVAPSPIAGVTRGKLNLDVYRAEWTAQGGELTGIVIDGNMRVEWALNEAASNGRYGQDLVEPMTELLKELVDELRRMARQAS